MRRSSWERPRRAPVLPPIFLMFVLTLSICLSATAQQAKWKDFDSTERRFQIGAVGLNFPKLGRDSLSIEFTREYEINYPDSLMRIFSSPFGWLERVDSVLWKQAYTNGFKVIGPTPRMVRASFNSRAVEHFAGYATADIQALPFEQGPASVINRDTVMHRLTWGLTVPQNASTTDPPRLIARGPRFTAEFLFYLGDQGLYNAVNLPDRSTWFRVGVTFKTDTSTDTFQNLPPSSILAYAILYRRVRTGQAVDTCKCHLYEPFDTLKATKSTYLLAAVSDSSSGYRDITRLIDFTRDTVIYARDSILTVRVTLWNANGDSIGLRDSITHTFIPYVADTVVGHVLGSHRDTTIGAGGAKTIVMHDTIRRYHVPLYKFSGQEFAGKFGAKWFGQADTDPTCVAYCNALLDSLPAGSVNEWVEMSDFHMKVYSTGLVPVTFLRTRINQEMYDNLRAGGLDSFLLKDISRIYDPANTLVDSVLGRLALQDEPIHERIRPSGYIARALQKQMRAMGDHERQLWHNPPGNFDGYRLLMEDFDTTSVKTVQNITRQDYKTVLAASDTDRVPIFYADPGLMDTLALYTVYRAAESMPRVYTDSVFLPDANGKLTIFSHTRTIYDTLPHVRMIAYDTADYRFYTEMRQRTFGKFADHIGLDATTTGPLVRQLARAVDVGKFKYARLGPPCPVWNMIQTGAWINTTDDPHHAPGGEWHDHWSVFRPPTPEEITAQVWLSLNCGADGIIYTDGVWDGAQLGFMDAYSGEWDLEYGTLKHANRDTWAKDTLGWTFPSMWIGFRSRFLAMQRVNRELRRLDSIVHLTNLVFQQEQMSLHDTRQTFASFPLLDTVYTRHARWYATAPGVKYLDSSAVDPPEKTYLEITHFLPGPMDTSGVARGAHYILFTNRRTWPVDQKTYDTAKTRRYYPAAPERGLGNIDVRRPIIRLKRATGVIADSFIVEKVGHESEWPSMRVAAGADVLLDHLEPGWGAMYRIVPIPAPISEHGTAWNNAVHGENTSETRYTIDEHGDTLGVEHHEGSRIVVYERDSAVYARVADSSGRWSGEWLISDVADTVRDPVTGARVADNMFPAIATQRTLIADAGTGNRSCLIVWERHHPDSGASVEAFWMTPLPTRTTFTDTTVRLRLTGPRTFVQSWMQLTPAVVSIDSGFIVAWAAPNYTTEIVAVRDRPFHGVLNTSAILRAKFPGLPTHPIDSATGYPTLAYVRNWQLVTENGGQRSATKEKDDAPTILGVDTAGWYHVAHLAYQQGTRSNNNWHIMYNRVGAHFPDLWSGNLPSLWLSQSEWVSNNMDGCEQLHPSIAVDSIRVGVAWETITNTRTINLRFRDSTSPRAWKRVWREPVYRWGEFDIRAGQPLRITGRSFERPSLTQFPSLDSAGLDGTPVGILAWQMTNDASGRRNRLFVYRYGDFDRTILEKDGVDPTMLLAPYVFISQSKALTTASIFHRGSLAEQFELRRPRGDTGVYYPGYLLNGPATPEKAFAKPLTLGGTIRGSFKLSALGPFPCTPVNGGMRVGTLIKIKKAPLSPGGGPPPWWEYGLPPTFFPPATKGPKPVDSLEDAWNLTRTGVFLAGDSAVTIRRTIEGNDSLIAWLNTQPNDSVTSLPANIYVVDQLVRASDDSVLWNGDTVSARGVGNDTLDQDLAIPVDVYASPDTAVYIRVAAFATRGLEFSMIADFSFLEEDSITGGGYKRVAPERRLMPGTMPETAIAMAVIPNPVRAGEAELRIRTTKSGTVRLAIYDLLGRRVLALPDLESESAGEYAMQVDLEQLRAGVYVVQAEMGRERGATRFTVTR